MAPPILYFNPNSIPCRGTWLVAKNLGIDFEIRKIDLLAKDQLRPEFLAINPQHVVPTLDDNGFVLWESKAISAYLADSRSPDSDWYPKDPKKRALINSRLYFEATVLHLRTRGVIHPILYAGATKIIPEAWKAVDEAFGFMETFLQESKWLAGEKPTLADCHALANTAVLVHLGANIDAWPKVKRWYSETCRELKAYDEHEAFVVTWTDILKSKLK